MRVERRFICSNVANNNNKYWYIIREGSTLTTQWGRVGDIGDSKCYGDFGSEAAAESEMSKMVRKKTGVRKGKASYREVDYIPEGETVILNQGKQNVAAVAKQIETACPITAKLVDYLVKVNVHDIVSQTQITYNVESGLFKTPLGIVGQPTVLEARQRLTRIGDAITLREKDGQGLPLDEYTRLVEDYIMLIPQNVGRRKLNLKQLFPDIAAVERQSSILDSLEASIKAATHKTTVVDDGGEQEKIFDCRLALLDDRKEVGRITKFYESTINSRHECRHLRPTNIYVVCMAAMEKRFKEVGKTVGNIQRYWHGTRASNLLSILKGGLIIPPTSGGTYTYNGRMFGNGVYFSDQSTKSLNYAYGYWGGGQRDNNCFMFLADVAMGQTFTPKGHNDRSRLPMKGFDSTAALANVSGVLNNEYVVYDVGQINLVYLVEFGT